MKIMVIYGNPKQGGFVHGCLDHVAKQLEQNGAVVDRLRLTEADICDCAGCFTCLRTGTCAINDGMAPIIGRMRSVDGFVTGASVRNGFFPALYKRFLERICYILGFGRELRGKPVLAIGAVGKASGKKALGGVLAFSGFQTIVTDYLFFRTNIPTHLKPQDVADRLDAAARRLHDAISSGIQRSFLARLSGAVDDFVVRRFMLRPNPDHVYDYIIGQWRKKGML
ncbi:MAG: flavodoxin family protein [bacterium]|nr:flavodoxin family protein [Candidatus Sumerlaeota bacterium]